MSYKRLSIFSSSIYPTSPDSMQEWATPRPSDAFSMGVYPRSKLSAYLRAYWSTSQSPILRPTPSSPTTHILHVPLATPNIPRLPQMVHTHPRHLPLPSVLTPTPYTFVPLPAKHSSIDCITLDTQIDALSLRKLYIDKHPLRGRRVNELDEEEEVTLEELLPRLAMR
ncbi:hypothetical protein DXG01_004191 [Tephrocybe rancida]|nr:hypothetical protein DXG01_004191 [Tephrocybe rancida]